MRTRTAPQAGERCVSCTFVYPVLVDGELCITCDLLHFPSRPAAATSGVAA